MKTTKINLDRPKISSEEIEKKQDFQKIVKGLSLKKPGVLRNPWFYGVVGACSLAAFVLIENSKTVEKPNRSIEISQASIMPIHQEKMIDVKSNSDKKIENASSTKEVKSMTSSDQSLINNAETNKEEEITAKKVMVKKIPNTLKKTLSVPNIGGVHSGAIKGSELLKWNIIESGTNEPIKSFMIGYFNGTTDVMEFVSGNELSEKLKHDIIAFNTGEMIFFTEMYSSDNEGKIHMLPSINLRILPN